MATLARAASSAARRPPPLLPPRLLAARAMASSLFGHVEPAPKDPILGVTEAFLADPSPDKVNVGVVRNPLRSANLSSSLLFSYLLPRHRSLSRDRILVSFLVLSSGTFLMKWNGTGAFAAGRLPGRQRPARRAQLRARGRAPDRGQPQHVRDPLLLLCHRSPSPALLSFFSPFPRDPAKMTCLERCCVLLDPARSLASARFLHCRMLMLCCVQV